MRNIRVLIIDDHSVVRSALRSLLERDAAIDVVGEAGGGQQACSMALETRADLVCLDCRMSGMDGIETTRRLLEALPEIKIIGLSAACDDGTESDMLAAGASSYVNKADVWEALLPAIHALFPRHAGQDGVGSDGATGRRMPARPLSPAAMQTMVQQLRLRQIALEAENAALRAQAASTAALACAPQLPEEDRQAKARAVAATSHALRQPLSAIGIYASMLKSQVAPAGQPLLANLKDCVASLTALLAKLDL